MTQIENLNVQAVCARLDAAAAARDFTRMSARFVDGRAQAVIARADEVMKDTFTFTKPWDMERCATPFTLTSYDWNVVMNDDEEWCFMLNRMDYLEDLCIAALATGELAYAIKARDLMLSWADAHKKIVPELSTRTLDTGIRLLAMTHALVTLRYLGVANEEEIGAIAACIDAQISYLPGQYLSKYETSNWGSIQTASIVASMCMLFDDPASDERFCWALERLEAQVAAQVYPDGVDWEQSTMYHFDVMAYLMRAMFALEARGLAVADHFHDTACRMAYALAAQVMPNGLIDAQGDSDRCSVAGLLSLAASVLGLPQLQGAFAEGPLNVFDLFEYGCATEDALLVATEMPELPCVFDGMDSGLLVARSAWTSDAHMTVFSSGPMGSGHGHADNLHVTCCWNGVPVLIDAGRYTYREDAPLRPALKGARAHNVPLLDGRSSSQPKGSWGYSDFAYPLKPYVRHAPDAGAHYWEAALVGHDPLHVLVRKLVALDCGIWFASDEICASGEHALESRFHMDPQVKVDCSEDHAALTTSAGDLILGSTATLTQSVEQCSLDYNSLSDQVVVDASSTFADRGSHVWWLAPSKVTVRAVGVLRNLSDPVGPELAHAYRFEFADGEFYTIAMFHQEVYTGVKAFSCEGVSFHAKCVLIHGVGDTRELTVLRA